MFAKTGEVSKTSVPPLWVNVDPAFIVNARATDIELEGAVKTAPEFRVKFPSMLKLKKEDAFKVEAIVKCPV